MTCLSVEPSIEVVNGAVARLWQRHDLRPAFG